MKHLRRTFLAMLLPVLAAPAFAQPRAFDIATFTPPEGWRVEERQNALSLLWGDDATGHACQLIIFGSQASSGEASRDFTTAWQNIVQKTFSGGAAPGRSAHRTGAGVGYLEGGADIVWNGNTLHADLLVLSVRDRVQSVLGLFQDRSVAQACRPHVAQVLDGLDYGKRAAGTAPGGAATAGAPSTPGDPGRFRGKGLVGVWMGFKMLYGKYEPSPRWFTFFDDGQVYEDLPAAGFVGFDRSASKTGAQGGYWGTYRYDGNSGQIEKPGVRFVTRIQAVKPGQIKLDSDLFYKCADVDGLRLQGAWTSYANPDDPNLDRLAPGKRPVITFTREGRFTDDGIFATFLHSSYSGDQSRDAAGSGTYEIKDFTLTLRYSDGRVKQVAITGLLGGNPAANDGMIYLERSRFRKRR